ncbi:MAG: hypothetical protein AAGF54_12575 [Pseudomonadota bacterium]
MLQMDELRNSQARNQMSTANTLKELRETRSRIEGLTGKISELEGTNATLLVRIRDLERQVRGSVNWLLTAETIISCFRHEERRCHSFFNT